MKIRFLKLQNWLIASLMSVFGLQACHSQKEVVKEQDAEPRVAPPDDRIRLMYGVPTRDFRVESIPDSAAPKTQPREPQVTVYGTPTVDYAVKGRVVDAKGKPIKGVQVMLVDEGIDVNNLPKSSFWEERVKQQSDTTDQEGNFALRISDRPWQQPRVMVRDIDGKQNGAYQDQIVEVTFSDEQQDKKDASAWYLGVKSAEVTVKMKNKK